MESIHQNSQSACCQSCPTANMTSGPERTMQ